MSRNWAYFFWCAAAYNLVIGMLGFIDLAGSLDGKATALLVFTFGIVYALVALRPLRLAPVLWAGVFGKLCMVALLGPVALSQEGNPALAPILIGDFLFTCGFLAFLLGPARRHGSTGEFR